MTIIVQILGNFTFFARPANENSEPPAPRDHVTQAEMLSLFEGYLRPDAPHDWQR